MNLLKGDIIKVLEMAEIAISEIYSQRKHIVGIEITNISDITDFQKATVSSKISYNEPFILRNEDFFSDVMITINVNVDDSTALDLTKKIFCILLSFFQYSRGNITRNFKKLLTQYNNSL